MKKQMTPQTPKNNSELLNISRFHRRIHTSEMIVVSCMAWCDINQAWDEGEAW